MEIVAKVLGGVFRAKTFNYEGFPYVNFSLYLTPPRYIVKRDLRPHFLTAATWR